MRKIDSEMVELWSSTLAKVYLRIVDLWKVRLFMELFSTVARLRVSIIADEVEVEIEVFIGGRIWSRREVLDLEVVAVFYEGRKSERRCFNQVE